MRRAGSEPARFTDENILMPRCSIVVVLIYLDGLNAVGGRDGRGFGSPLISQISEAEIKEGSMLSVMLLSVICGRDGCVCRTMAITIRANKAAERARPRLPVARHALAFDGGQGYGRTKAATKPTLPATNA